QKAISQRPFAVIKMVVTVDNPELTLKNYLRKAQMIDKLREAVQKLGGR
ncbi:MEG-2 (ESP15) family, partial [Schistosoma mansoni]